MTTKKAAVRLAAELLRQDHVITYMYGADTAHVVCPLCTVGVEYPLFDVSRRKEDRYIRATARRALIHHLTVDGEYGCGEDKCEQCEVCYKATYVAYKSYAGNYDMHRHVETGDWTELCGLGLEGPGEAVPKTGGTQTQ